MRRLGAATATVLMLVGCSQSSEKAAKEARQTAGSWGATLSAAAPVDAVASQVDAIEEAATRGDRAAAVGSAHAAASAVPAEKTAPVARPR